MIGYNLERFANSPANLEHATLLFWWFGGQKWDIVNDFPLDILLHCEYMASNWMRNGKLKLKLVRPEGKKRVYDVQMCKNANPAQRAMKEPNLSSIFLLSESVQNYWSDTTMISVAYRTSFEMFCDVKLHFSQLLKAHVSYGGPFWFSIFWWKSSFQQKKKKKDHNNNKHFGVLASVRQVRIL